jgi:hypothetical protein
MKEILSNLLEELEKIGESNEEIYDSECREKMDDAIWYGFLVPDIKYQLSDDFGLYNESANSLVKHALQKYIFEASNIAASNNMSFLERLAAFQDNDVFTLGSKNDYNDFFGYSNPEEFNNSGKWLGFKSRDSIIGEDSKYESSKNCLSDETNKQLSLFDIQAIIDGD